MAKGVQTTSSWRKLRVVSNAHPGVCTCACACACVQAEEELKRRLRLRRGEATEIRALARQNDERWQQWQQLHHIQVDGLSLALACQRVMRPLAFYAGRV